MTSCFVFDNIFTVIIIPQLYMAKTKSKGSTRMGGNPKPKYLGIKVNHGQSVKPGMIIVKQRGTTFLPGRNVRAARDWSLYATKEGIVSFKTKRVTKFDSTQRIAKIVEVI